MSSMHLSDTETAEEAWTSVDVRMATRQQAQILHLALPVIAERVSVVLDSVDVAGLTRVTLAGCGDSFYAALASKLAFELWSGLPTEALPSMEFSRYSVATVGPQALVACLSNSGRVSRTIEAARLASSRGAPVIGVTGRTDSNLAKASTLVLSQLIPTPDLPPGAGSLGLANYLVTLLSLYEIALQTGERRKVIDGHRVDQIRAHLSGVPAMIEATYDSADGPASDLAAALAREPVLYMIGAGPSLATTYFGCAKLYEQPRYEGVPQELEEWAHLQYFMVGEGTPHLFVVPPGASRGRSLELIEVAQKRGATAAALGDHADHELAALADRYLPVVGDLPEELTPLLYLVPLELLADSLANAADRIPRPPRRQVPADEEESFEFRRIYGSEQVN